MDESLRKLDLLVNSYLELRFMKNKTNLDRKILEKQIAKLFGTLFFKFLFNFVWQIMKNYGILYHFHLQILI